MFESLISPKVLRTWLEMARNTPSGAFVEVGVYRGGSAVMFYDLAQEQGRDVFLFDTFTGIPERSPIDSHLVGDFADTDAKELIDRMPMAKFCIGKFPDTDCHTGPVAFAHIDCDQYVSTKAAIDAFYPRMIKGGIMAFDDWPLSGAQKAIVDAFDNIRFLPEDKAFVRF
jgi:predicted O-methyltransferase YrrM